MEEKTNQGKLRAAGSSGERRDYSGNVSWCGNKQEAMRKFFHASTANQIWCILKITCVCMLLASIMSNFLQPNRDYHLPGSSVYGILQARILEWLPCPPPGYLSNPGIEPEALKSLALAILVNSELTKIMAERIASNYLMWLSLHW